MRPALRGIIIAIIAYCLFAATLAERETETGDIKVGGWQKIPLEKKASYSEGLAFLLREANQLSSRDELLQVERQVVAGFNYRYTLQTAELGVVEAVVYKDLNGDFELIDVRPIRQQAKDL
jgi:hypothetical protein